LITLIFAFLLGCLLESHNKGSPTHLKEVDDAHNARGANRSALRQPAVQEFRCERWPTARRFDAQGLHFFTKRLVRLDGQCFTEDRSTPIDLAYAGIAAALGDGGLLLLCAELHGQRLRRASRCAVSAVKGHGMTHKWMTCVGFLLLRQWV
jgi:hypothetical protein